MDQCSVSPISEAPAFSPKALRGLLLKFSVLEFLVASTWASSSYYYVLYLRAQGMSDLQTGFLLAGTCAMSLFGRIFWPALSDRLRRSKLMLYVLYALSAACMFTVRFLPHGFIGFSIVLFSCNTFVILPAGSILDGWFFRLMRGRELLFGRVRACFSLGICLMVFLNGITINLFGWDALFATYGLCVIALLGLVVFTREAPFPAKDTKKAAPSPVSLFRNSRYLLIVSWATITMLFCALVYNFVSVKCEVVDPSTWFYGSAMLVYGLFEASCTALAPKLSGKLRPKPLLALSVLAFSVQGLIMALSGSHASVYLAMPFQGIGFGLFAFTIKYYIVTITPEELKASAQGTAEAFYYGFGGLVSGLLGGWMMDRFGLSAVLLVGGLFILLCSAFLFFNSAAEQKKH